MLNGRRKMVADAFDGAELSMIIDAEHGGAAHDTDIGHRGEFGFNRGDPGCSIAVAKHEVLRQQAATELKIFFGENDPGSAACSRQCSRQAAGA